MGDERERVSYEDMTDEDWAAANAMDDEIASPAPGGPSEEQIRAGTRAMVDRQWPNPKVIEGDYTWKMCWEHVSVALKAAYAIDVSPSPPGPARITDEMEEAALEGYRQASHGCNAIPEWIRGALEAALPHEFVETDPVSVQPNPAQTSEVEAVAREMRDAQGGWMPFVGVGVGLARVRSWADRLSPSRGAEEERRDAS